MEGVYLPPFLKFKKMGKINNYEYIDNFPGFQSAVQQEDHSTEIKMNILRKVLPIYHDVKRGCGYGEKGCQLIYRKFCKILNSLNIEIIDIDFFKKNTAGKFDDNFAEAVSVIHPSEDNLFPEYHMQLDNKICKVVEDGFMDRTSGKIITFAKVIVYKNN